MSTVDYIPFATGGGASVTPQATYVTDAPTGVVPGLADPALANKSWRQSSMFAAAVANFISATLGINVLDDGNITNLISELTSAIQVGSTGALSTGMGVPQNMQIMATVGSNNLTISLVGTNGSAPSATNPITIPFRDATIATGDVVSRALTGALSFTINSGNTMGVAANNQPFRLWVFGMDNGGTVLLGAILCSTTSQIFPLNEDALQTATGTNGGSTAGAFYANAAAAAKSIRILGYLEWSAGLATTGLWAAIPTKIQLFGPGQKKPGDTVQRLFCTTSTQATGTIAGTKVNLSGFSPAPTPTLTATMNLVRAKLVGSLGSSTTGAGYVQLFRGTNATPIGGVSPMAQAAGGTFGIQGPVDCEAIDLPATLTPTYGAFVLSTNSSGTAVWLQTLQSIPASSGLLTIEEIMG